MATPNPPLPGCRRAPPYWTSRTPGRTRRHTASPSRTSGPLACGPPPAGRGADIGTLPPPPPEEVGVGAVECSGALCDVVPLGGDPPPPLTLPSRRRARWLGWPVTIPVSIGRTRRQVSQRRLPPDGRSHRKIGGSHPAAFSLPTSPTLRRFLVVSGIRSSRNLSVFRHPILQPPPSGCNQGTTGRPAVPPTLRRARRLRRLSPFFSRVRLHTQARHPPIPPPPKRMPSIPPQGFCIVREVPRGRCPPEAVRRHPHE